jgi:hypothetical protein
MSGQIYHPISRSDYKRLRERERTNLTSYLCSESFHSNIGKSVTQSIECTPYKVTRKQRSQKYVKDLKKSTGQIKNQRRTFCTYMIYKAQIVGNKRSKSIEGLIHTCRISKCKQDQIARFCIYSF